MQLKPTLYCIIFLLVLSKMSNADLIYREDFDSYSNITIGGGYDHSWITWEITSLNGTAQVPSGFIQGGGQSESIFFGSFAKGITENGIDEPSPTLMIDLPNLTDYENITLTVALAAPDGTTWESSHRDALIISGTKNIDGFLPTTRGAPLTSINYYSDLHYQFQDYVYSIDASFTNLTFTFASTDYNEYIGIDAIRISGDRISNVPEPSILMLICAAIIPLLFLKRKINGEKIHDKRYMIR